jgi:hypothetical protein
MSVFTKDSKAGAHSEYRQRADYENERLIESVSKVTDLLKMN